MSDTDEEEGELGFNYISNKNKIVRIYKRLGRLDLLVTAKWLIKSRPNGEGFIDYIWHPCKTH